jgi:hypothetical protein
MQQHTHGAGSVLNVVCDNSCVLSSVCACLSVTDLSASLPAQPVHAAEIGWFMSSGCAGRPCQPSCIWRSCRPTGNELCTGRSRGVVTWFGHVHRVVTCHVSRRSVSCHSIQWLWGDFEGVHRLVRVVTWLATFEDLFLRDIFADSALWPSLKVLLHPAGFTPLGVTGSAQGGMCHVPQRSVALGRLSVHRLVRAVTRLATWVPDDLFKSSWCDSACTDSPVV